LIASELNYLIQEKHSAFSDQLIRLEEDYSNTLINHGHKNNVNQTIIQRIGFHLQIVAHHKINFYR
jgi:hypothetical protein